MTEEQMVEAIYNKIANKELSTWCVIQINEVRGMCDKDSFSLVYNKDISRYANEYITIDYSDLLEKLDNYEDIEFEWNKIKSAENKWHPVMIGDVFDWVESEKWAIALYEKTEYVIPDVWDWPETPTKLENIPHDFTEWASYSEPLTVLEVINWLWEKKRRPIEEQSEECKEYVYNLLTNA